MTNASGKLRSFMFLNSLLTVLVKYIVYKKDGEPIQDDEAVHLLKPYGEVAKVEDLPTPVRQQLNLPTGAKLVSYAMYDAKRDVVKVSRP